MPRYGWKFGGEEAEKQYDNLPEDSRRLVNQRIQELQENPIDIPDREYDARNDTHTIPIGDDKGFIVYAVVENVRMVIGYRFTPGLH
ncbi:MAG TPA: hypothetical protein VFN75_06300 [Pseudonocardiaceae bacterium]|nr:hypothetical protein [Pseudonocardiaceae bacterium]